MGHACGAGDGLISGPDPVAVQVGNELDEAWIHGHLMASSEHWVKRRGSILAMPRPLQPIVRRPCSFVNQGSHRGPATPAPAATPTTLAPTMISHECGLYPGMLS